MKINLPQPTPFERRHNATPKRQIQEMLNLIGVDSIEQLINETVPASIRLKKPLNLPSPLTERQFLTEFKSIASKNKLYRSFIGTGYYNTVTPSVILRNILENPGWYTAYTPYQAEIAQGRLEMLINFQTMVADLTGMELANASLLDEGTAAAEAMAMLHAARKKEKKNAEKFFVSSNCHPQTIDVLKTRAIPLGIELVIADLATFNVTTSDIFGVLIQYPDTNGSIKDHSHLIAAAHENHITVAMATDLLSLTILKAPGEMGADVVIGSAQRFGVPMGYGGPHAAFFATRDEYKRLIPGRIIGVSKDAAGKTAYRMALQTREQHIKREKATSNICTAQVLLAVMAAAYGLYHGPEGLKNIGTRVHGYTAILSSALKSLGLKVTTTSFFDTINVAFEKIADRARVRSIANDHQMNFRILEDDSLGISLDEVTTPKDVQEIVEVFAFALGKEAPTLSFSEAESSIPSELMRTSSYMTHEVFNTLHAEHDILRYLKHLENKDLSLTHSMISLGSCTMKLNATTEMIPVTWPELGGMHPFVPVEQASGYSHIFSQLESWLCEITGFDAVSLQPNSGAQGEYAGLMTIRAYHESRGDFHRNVALIPSSAHGTNPASAVMAGMKVVIVRCDEKGNIDMDDLASKAEEHKNELSALLVTYPSTHGVFEESIVEMCKMIHDNGGKVYMDGANMNAQVGLTSPANIGADVCHLNLHKTFCIPHGGGGPGMGPIGVTKDLAPFLPGHVMAKTGGEKGITAVSAAPWGSASILAISYAYIAMMGAEGVTNATKLAILNANYIKERIKNDYKVLYSGAKGRAAHEFIIDCRDFKKAGIEVEDIAKRLMDYGFHSPTVSFPVPGTMMIEPTESETKPELDRFCEALISIRKEIAEIENGSADAENNVLKNAPHTADLVINDTWPFPYSRQKAVYPLAFVKESKFWPTVRRIDSAYGDRNLMCSCVPLEEYA